MFKNKLKNILGKKTNEKEEENEKLEENMNNTENKKKLENLIFLAIVLIITIIAINLIWNGKEEKEEINSKNTVQNGKVLAKNNETEETKRNQVEVPNVEGMTISEAKKKLQEVNLSLQIQDEPEELDESTAVITEQLPQQGISVYEETKILVKVSI